MMQASVSSVRIEPKREPEEPTSVPAADCASRAGAPSTSSKMPPRISGHDLMAIFPTNPPPHTVSCDDLFKKQARQFLSTPEPPAAKRDAASASASASPSPPGSAPRTHATPGMRLHPQPVPGQHAPGQQRQRVPSGRVDGPQATNHYETRQPEGTARRTPPERRKGGADPASPLPLFTRQPLSLDRSRTSSSQA